MSSTPSTDQVVPFKPIYSFQVSQSRINAAIRVFQTIQEITPAVVGRKELVVEPANDTELELVTAALDKRGIKYTARTLPERGLHYGLPMETVLEVFHELGLSQYIYWVTDEDIEDKRLVLDERLTDLQYVALAAALAAVKESNGKQRLSIDE